MKIVLFLTISTGLIFAAQTASILKEDEESDVTEDVHELEKITKDAATQTEDDDFQIAASKLDSSDDLWNENFETTNLAEEINSDLQLPEQILQILRQPFNSPDQITIQLEPTLTTPQYETIRIKVYTTTDDDEFAASTSIIETEVFSNNPEQNVERTKHEIHSRKDPILDTLPDDLSPAIRNQLANFEARYVANRLIDLIKNEIVPQSEPSETPLQTNQYVLPYIDENLVDEIQQPVDQTGQRSSKIEPQSKPFKIPPTTNPYTLPGIDKNLIDGLQGSFDQTWQGPDYQVRLKHNSSEGDVELWWKKNEDDIYLHRFANGAVDQNWGFGTVHIGLFRDEDGNQIQVWSFGQTKLEYITGTGTKESNHRVWEFNNKDEASYWKYRHIIKLWCKANGFFVGEEACLIY